VKRSYPKNITIVSIVFIACILFLAAVNLYVSIQFRNEFIAFERKSVASVAALCSFYLRTMEDNEDLFFQLKYLNRAFEFEHMIVCDTSGRRIYDSRFLRPQFLLSQSRVDFSREFKELPAQYELVQNNNTYLYRHNDPAFYLYLVHSSSYLSSFDVLFRWHIFYITFSLIFVGFLGIFLIRNLFLPMRYVTKLAHDLGVEMQKEEFVSETFNEMFKKMKIREQMLVEFSTYIAHEFRNSIGAISGMARLVEKGKKGASDIVRECKTMEQLINRLLEYSKPLEMVPSEFKVGALCQKAIERSRPPRHITVESTVEPADLCYTGDFELLVMALANLLKNSYEAILSKGNVAIKAGTDKGVVMIMVSDTGTGINQKDIEKIFTPFYSGKADGMGLGLAYVNRVLELHNGRIKVDSVQGKGTTFTIHLPQ
jgi:signal transduction histidine kinase